MSTRYNNGSHYENHRRAAELHDAAAHAHRAASQHGQTEHLTSHELSRQAMEQTREAHRLSQETGAPVTKP
jgi:DNA-binding transcriptional regulator YiaG